MADDSTISTPKKGKARREWKSLFLAALSDGGSVTSSALAAGVDRTTAYLARQSDPGFAAQWDDSIEAAIQSMEVEAYRRAVKGCEKPVYHQGVECGRIREYSDTLLIFLIKANRPEKYREARPDTIVNVEVAAAEPDVARAALKAAKEASQKTKGG